MYFVVRLLCSLGAGATLHWNPQHQILGLKRGCLSFDHSLISVSNAPKPLHDVCGYMPNTFIYLVLVLVSSIQTSMGPNASSTSCLPPACFPVSCFAAHNPFMPPVHAKASIFDREISINVHGLHNSPKTNQFLEDKSNNTQEAQVQIKQRPNAFATAMKSFPSSFLNFPAPTIHANTPPTPTHRRPCHC